MSPTLSFWFFPSKLPPLFPSLVSGNSIILVLQDKTLHLYLLLFFLFPAISRHLIFVYFLSIFSIKMSSHVKMDSNISLTMRCKWTLQLNISCLLLFPYPLFIAQNNQPVDLLVRLAVEYSPEVEKLGD